MNDLVSVIVPAYNAERFIEATLLSVLHQTHQNLEIIVVNDGSTDQTLKAIENIKSAKIKVINKKNGGASAAKQTGLEEAKGNYIQYLDADDLLSKNKITSQVDLLKQNPNAISLCATVHFLDQTNHESYPIIDEWYAKEQNNPIDFLIKLYGGSLIGPSYGGMIQPNAFLVPRSIIEKAGAWNITISPCADEDGEYFCRIILASSDILYTPNGVNYYRKFKQKNSLSSLKSELVCSNILRSTLLKTNHLLAHTDDPKAKLAMSAQLWGDAFMFYPAYKNLSSIAEKMAKKLYANLKVNPFINPVKKKIYLLFGWKFVLMIDHYRFIYLNDKKNS